VLGVWLSLQLTRRWKLRRNSFFYFARASIYLTVLIGVAWLASGPRLALFPAAGLLFLSLACLAPWSWLKGLFWVLAPFWIFRMVVLSECHKFVFRSAAMAFAALKTLPLTLVFWAVLGLFFLLWTMPFLLGFAAAYRTGRGDLWALKRFRRPLVLFPIGILVVAGAVYLRTVPAYVGPWEQEVTVTQKLDAGNKTAVEFSSSGFLRGIKAVIDGREEMLTGWKAFKRVEMPLELDWLKEQVTRQIEEKGEETFVQLKLQLDFEKPPLTVNVRFKSKQPFRVDRANIEYRHAKPGLHPLGP
jgi:hypothetical protein